MLLRVGSINKYSGAESGAEEITTGTLWRFLGLYYLGGSERVACL